MFCHLKPVTKLSVNFSKKLFEKNLSFVTSGVKLTPKKIEDMPDEKTFELEDGLPNLTVPDLDTTIQKYLDSVKAVATDAEFSKTFNFCQNFRQKEGPILQKKLKEREKKHRNWVDEWWLNLAYLETRTPLTHCNFSGVTSFEEEIWPIQEGTQLYRSSFSLHLLASFWKNVREERVPPHKNSRGKAFSMNQLMLSYNISRVPQRKRDKLVSYFKLAKDGDCPDHSAVFYRGNVFKIHLFDKEGNPHTQPQFEDALHQIVERCNNKNRGSDIACLTSLDRDKWADLREHLIDLNVKNKDNLKEIESAIHALCLDDQNKPQTWSDTMKNSMIGDPSVKWLDKSYSEIWTSNGVYGANCDHSPVDGMVMTLYIDYMMKSLKKCAGDWNRYQPIHKTSDKKCRFDELCFEVDDKIKGAIQEGRILSQELSRDLDVQVLVFNGVGRDALKQYKFHPDGFVQIAMQLAYMRMYNGKPAAAYETATTRRFYHGRTETCRTCTPELVEFCRSFISGSRKNDRDLFAKLMNAHHKFVWLMNECSNNRGCDRHLFGLQVAAAESKMEIPEIFTDEMFVKSGGNGNFDLSTSFTGFFDATGAVAPMKLDGYGFFYRINHSRIVYSLLSWKPCATTDCDQLRRHLDSSFQDVFELIERNMKIKSKV